MCSHSIGSPTWSVIMSLLLLFIVCTVWLFKLVITCYAGFDLCSLQHCVPGHRTGLLPAFSCAAHFRSREPLLCVSLPALHAPAC